MLKKVRMYGLDDPYWFYISIVSALVLVLTDPKGTWWLAGLFVLIAIYEVFKTTRKFRIIDSLLTDQALLGAKKGLDISAGTGYSTVRLAQAGLNGYMTGIEDSYQNGTNRALSNAFKRKVSKRVNIMSADTTKLPFADGSFDVITANYSNGSELSYYNTKQRKALVAEMVRLITKDGHGKILMVNRKRQINKFALLFQKHPGFEVYIAAPDIRIRLGYVAMMINVKKV